MISPQMNLECVAKLGMLREFPPREDSAAQVAKFLNELCANDEEAQRLTTIVCDRCAEWPGPAMLREIYQTEIAPRELPQGCELGRDLKGFRRVFQVMKRGDECQYFYPDAGWWAETKMRDQLAARFSRPEYYINEAVTPCFCALGRYRSRTRR